MIGNNNLPVMGSLIRPAMVVAIAVTFSFISPVAIHAQPSAPVSKEAPKFDGWNLTQTPWGMLLPAVERKVPPLTDGGVTEILGVSLKYFYWDTRLDDGRSASHGFYFIDDRLSLYSKAFDAGTATTIKEAHILKLYEAGVKRYGKPNIEKPNTAVWLRPVGEEDAIVELILAEVKEPISGQNVRLYRMMYYGPNFPGLDRIRWAKGLP